MLKLATLKAGIALVAASLMVAGPASAQDDGPISYTVKKGDTLYGLQEKYLVGANAARSVQRLNGITNPRYLPVAKVLKIPRELLRYETVDLKVAGFSGPVEIASRRPAVGASLGVGDLVTTGRGGFVSFRASNGAQVSLPSNTSARLLRARKYVLDGILDVDFSVLKGRGEAVSPKLGPQGRMRMRTPNSVTAVRGTEFRVAYVEEGERSLTEVVTGAVGVAAGGQEKATAAGFGVASGASGVGENEALLPAPDIAKPGAVQTGKTLIFDVTPAEAAQGYRAQIATDAGFLEVVSEQIVAEGPAEFDNLENGRYFVRARAISDSGLEGFSTDPETFRRKRLDVAAAVEESPLADGFLFKWLPEGEGETVFAFQMWREGEADRLLVDETGMRETGLILTDLENGNYVWRVAAIQAVEEGLLKVWGPEQKLSVSE